MDNIFKKLEALGQKTNCTISLDFYCIGRSRRNGKTVRVDIFSRVIVMYDNAKKDVSRGLRRGFGVFDDFAGGVTPV